MQNMMTDGCMMMGGWLMMGLGILVVVLLVLAIAALIKYLFFDRRRDEAGR